ncbi:UNVERIFIED_CONTAM: hypothetical protein FKN15_053094 [Acipenser sinensis]
MCRQPTAFFSHCGLTMQPPKTYSVGGQRSSQAAYRQARRHPARLQRLLVRDVGWSRMANMWVLAYYGIQDRGTGKCRIEQGKLHLPGDNAGVVVNRIPPVRRGRLLDPGFDLFCDLCIGDHHLHPQEKIPLNSLLSGRLLEVFEDHFMSVSEHSPTASTQGLISPPLFPLSGIPATSKEVPPEQDTTPLPAVQGIDPRKSKRLQTQDISPEHLYFKDWTIKLIKTPLKNGSDIPAGSNQESLFIFYCESISAESIFPPKKTPQLRSAVQRPRWPERGYPVTLEKDVIAKKEQASTAE